MQSHDIRKGTRRLKWDVYIGCYAAARAIQKEPARFDELLEEKFFGARKYKAHIKDVLRLSLLVVTGANVDGPSHKTACEVAKQLSPFFKKGTKPSALLKAIEANGGLKRLHRNTAPSTGMTEPEKRVNGHVSPWARSIPFESRPGRKTAKLSRRMFDVGKPSPVKGMVALHIEMSEAEANKIFKSPDHRRRLTIEHRPSNKEWKRFVATSVKIVD